MLRFVLLGLLAASALGSFIPRHPLQERIVGGSPAEAGEFPSQLSFQVSRYHTCSASIINANWAMTTASCVVGHAYGAITLLSGSLKWTSIETRHYVSNIIMHRYYNPADSDINDIALIEVVEPFEMSDLVQPIKLPEQNQTTETGATATVIGWGSDARFEEISETLQKVDIEIRDQDFCNEAYSYAPYPVYPSHICADSPQGNLGTCDGDGGSPLFVDGVVVGIESWKAGCAEKGTPTVYTRISSYIDWITETTGGKIN